MNDRKAKLIIGSLLHDIGKVIYREGGDKRNHSVSGYDYLKEEADIKEKEILDCVKYHHALLLKSANLEDDNLAYITYIADNIAAFADRREKENVDDKDLKSRVPLQSIFNILNGNKQEYYYQPGRHGSGKWNQLSVRREEKLFTDILYKNPSENNG